MTWQKQLQNAIKQPEELLEHLQLSHEQEIVSDKAQNEFDLLVTSSFLSGVEKGDINDPLLKQVLPVKNEESESTDFTADPVGDLNAQKSSGLLHKYHGRVLLIVTGACPIHCRYCFRRHYPYSNNSITSKEFSKALEYINQNTEITEVILSGGDPLVLTDEKLIELIKKLEKIKHLKKIRIHTRTPIVLPERILESNLDWISKTRLKTVIVVHCNHKNEITDNVTTALVKLTQYNAIVLNQSVLLKGVNDDPQSLIELSESLFESNVLPYYLHQLDKVKGAMHFFVDDTQAKNLIKKISERLPGYLVPKLVCEIEGEESKRLL